MKDQRVSAGPLAYLMPLLVVGFLLLPPAVFASSGAETHGSSVLMKDFLYRCLNFSIMLVAMGFFMVKPIKNALAKYRQGIAEDLKRAQFEKESATQAKLELEESLAGADEELRKIREGAAEEGRRDSAKALEHARQLSESIIAEVDVVADREKSAVVAEVKRQAVQLAVQIAEEILQKELAAEDHARLFDKYLQQVGEVQ